MAPRRKVDRLSNMPDDVISHILSLMPTKYAVRTYVLSKSWVHSWKSVTNLDIDDHHPFLDMHCFIKYVNRVLKCCEASQVQLFRLHCLEIWVPSAIIKKWIEKATRLNVSDIEINSILFDFPRPFICKTLTKLTLVCNPEWKVRNITTPVDFPLLKTLEMKGFSIRNHNAFKIISGCPLLESLSLYVVYHGRDKVYNFNIPTLKRLTLHFGKGVWVKKIVLNVPNLEELFVYGGLCSPVVMENFPPRVSVTLSCFFAPGLDQLWVELLTGISGAKSITMELVHENPCKSPMPKFLNLKHLEFRFAYGDPMNLLLIYQIIESSDELDHLCIEETPESPCMVEPKDPCWIEPQSVSNCILKNLRTIKFIKFKGRKSDVEFMAYMLGNAQVLKTLAIMCGSIPMRKNCD